MNRKTEKSLALLLCLSMVLGMFSALAVPQELEAATSAYNAKAGGAYNKGKGVTRVRHKNSYYSLEKIDNGDYAIYNSINFNKGAGKMTVRYYKSTAAKATTVTMRARVGSTKGTVIATMTLTDKTSGWKTKTVTCTTAGKKLEGTKNICLVFTVKKGASAKKLTSPGLKIGNFKFATTASAVTKPAKPVITSVRNVGGDYPYRITWQKVTGATGYEIQISYNKEFKSSVFKADRGSNCYANYRGRYNTISYTRVRAYKKIGVYTIYGSWSDVKQFK